MWYPTTQELPVTTSAHRSLADIQRQIHALGTAVPFVVHHRLSRLAAAGVQPSAVDQEEFTAMGMEKIWQSCFGLCRMTNPLPILAWR